MAQNRNINQTILVDGSVGIGETSPSTKLYIKNTAGDADITLQGSSQTMRIDQNSIKTTTASQIAIFTNNTTTNGIYISSTGNVGIGTTSPSAKLSVNGTGYVVDSFAVYTTDPATGGTSNGYIQIQGEGNESGNIRNTYWKIQNTIDSQWGNGALVFYKNYDGAGFSEQMRIASNGNVGIGTTSPAEKFEIQDSAASNLVAKISQTNASYQGWWQATSQDGKYINVGVSNNADNYSYINTSKGTLRFLMNSSIKMTLNSSGNVGIGTTSPNGTGWDESSTVLHVYKNTTNGGLLKLESSNTTAILNAGDNQLAVFTTTADPIRFGTAGSERMRITSAGNVGIGTTSPSQKLHVAGKLLVDNGDLGGTAGDSIYHAEITGTRHHLDFKEIRTANGTDWMNTTYKLQMRVDSTNHQSIDFVSDANALEHIDILTGNQQFNTRFTYDGKVGIGTTSLDAKLHVKSASSNSYVFRAMSSTGTDLGGIFESTNGDGEIYLKTSAIATNVRLSSNGSSYLNGGNVGIGTTSPADKLEVAGNISIGGSYKLYNGSASDSAGITFPGSTTRIDGFYGITFHASSTNVGGQSERMRITASGNVGIGTTSPSSRLHIAGSDGTWDRHLTLEYDASNVVKIVGDTDGLKLRTMNSGKGFYFRNSANSTNLIITDGGNVGIGTTSPGEKLTVNGAIGYQYGGTQTWHTYANSANSWELVRSGIATRMIVTSDGNVGIGITSPSYKLSVNGDAGIEGSENYLYFHSSATVGSNARARMRAVGAGGGSGYGGDLRIDTRASNNVWNENVVTVANTGNVGIGTTSPSEKLHVNAGKILINGGQYNLLVDHGANSGGAGVILQSTGSNLPFVRWTDGTNINAGIRSSSALDLRFQTNGFNDRMTINSAGNVGIGTTSPSYKIHAQTNAATWGYRFENNTSDQDVHTFLSHGSGYGIAVDSTSNSSSTYLLKLAGGAGGTGLGSVEHFRVTSAGNVGIGTSSPAVKLQIQTSTSASTSVEGLRIYNAGGGIGAGVKIGLGVGATYSEKGYIRTDIVSGGAGRMFFGVNGGDVVTINNSGNVLIGTTTDNGKKLQVNGDVFIKGSASSSAYADAIFEVQNSNGTSIMDFRGDAYAFFGCGQGGGAASGFIFRYNDTAHVQFTGYNYGNGAGSYKPILLDTDLVGRGQGIYVNFGGTGYANPAPTSSTEFAVRGRTSDATENVMELRDSNNAEKFVVKNDGSIVTDGSQGWTGTVAIPNNPPGSQNLEFKNGILINVY